MSNTTTIAKFNQLPTGKRVAIVLGAGVAVATVLAFVYREEIVQVVKNIGPRGIRNNNPGNVRIGENWLGAVPASQNTDGQFEQFNDMKFGMRAQMKVLQNYQRLYGLSTLRAITYRYAPKGDGSNNPDRYAEFVAKHVGVNPDAPINLAGNLEVLAKVAHYMAIMENGWQWLPVLSLSEYQQATRLL